MDFKYYIDRFRQAADALDPKMLQQEQLEVAVGVVMDSVYLKLHKRSWTNPGQDPLTAETRIFFSIWIDAKAVAEQKLLYNIHAFKLRKLKGYRIPAIKFAEAFRDSFKDLASQWPNVRTDFGPLTLMEGQVKIDLRDFQRELTELSGHFITAAPLLDQTLEKFRNP